MSVKEILTILALVALGLCVIIAGAKMAMKKSDQKTSCDKACGMLVFIAVVLIAVSKIIDEKSGFHHPSHKGDLLLKCGSADSWCGYSKKMSAQEEEMKRELKKHGIDLELISDSKDKKKFEEFKKKHNPRGFPHCTLYKAGKKIGDLPGYMPAKKLAEKVASMK